MKIGIDLRALYTGSKYRGIGVYTRNLIEAMLRIAPEHEYHFLNLYGDFPDGITLNERCFVHSYYQGPIIQDLGDRNIFRIPELERIREAQVKNFLENSKIDLMLWTSLSEYGYPFKIDWFQSVKTAAIIHDLIPLIFPQQCLFDNRYKKDYMESLDFIKGVDLLLSNSQATKDDCVRLLKIPREKISVVMAGIGQKYLNVQNRDLLDVKERFSLCDDYFLFAGGIDFKKNIERIITAYGKLPHKYSKNMMLVISGKTDKETIRHYMNEAEKAGVGDRVICTDYLSDEELIALYSNARALVFPSLYEGFGIPVLEAMACGTPVITSDNSSLKEIGAGYAILVDPKDTNQICKAMLYVIMNPEKVKETAQDAVLYAKQFTWERVAEKTLDAMKNAPIPVLTERKSKRFHVENSLLECIAREYCKNNLPLSERECTRISDELYALEKQAAIPAIPCGRRILYDVTVAQEWFANNYVTGIGRVSLEIYNEIKKIAEVVPVCVKKENGKFVFHSVDMRSFQIQDDEIELSARDVYFMPELQLKGIHVSSDHINPAVLWEKGIRTYAVLYDILPLQMPQYFEKETAKAFYPYVRDMVSNYNGILTDSMAVSDELIEFLKTHPELFPDHELQIGFFHNGCDHVFKNDLSEAVFPDIEDIFKKKTFLMVGTLEPRKGHSYVLSVFESLWERGTDVHLCIIGHIGWNMNIFVGNLRRHPEYKKKLFFLEGATDSELSFAYRHATVLIQASAGEGFGLPLIEAGYYGLPVFCSDIPVFHEVAGENASYFRRDTDELKQLILAVKNGDKSVLKDSKRIKGTLWKDTTRKIANMILGGVGWAKTICGSEIKDAVQIPEIFHAVDYGSEDEYVPQKRVLFVFQNNFLRGGQGTNNRVTALARAVRDAGFILDVLGAKNFSEYDWSDIEEENKEHLIDIVRVYDYRKGYKEDGKIARKYKKMQEARAGQKLPDWSRPGMRCMLEEMLDENQYEAVCVFYAFMLPLFRDLPISCKKIYFMEDCSFLQQYFWDYNNPKVRLGALLNDELERLADVDEIFCISYDEKGMYERFINRKIHFLPHLMEKRAPLVPANEYKWDAYFIGYNNPYNVEGIKWYIDHVVPLLPEDFRTVIVGTVTQEIKDYPQNVDVIPFAENLNDIYANSSVCICPMFHGTGMKIKVVEAMAHGIPIVCTERGVDGLPDKMLSGCLVTNTPDEFAQYLVKLVQDNEFYLACKQKIENYFTIIFDRERYVALLRNVLKQGE